MLQVALDLMNEATSQVKMINESVSEVLYTCTYICVVGHLLKYKQMVVVVSVSVIPLELRNYKISLSR